MAPNSTLVPGLKETLVELVGRPLVTVLPLGMPEVSRGQQGSGKVSRVWRGRAAEVSNGQQMVRMITAEVSREQ